MGPLRYRPRAVLAMLSFFLDCFYYFYSAEDIHSFLIRPSAGAYEFLLHKAPIWWARWNEGGYELFYFSFCTDLEATTTHKWDVFWLTNITKLLAQQILLPILIVSVSGRKGDTDKKRLGRDQMPTAIKRRITERTLMNIVNDNTDSALDEDTAHYYSSLDLM